MAVPFHPIFNRSNIEASNSTNLWAGTKQLHSQVNFKETLFVRRVDDFAAWGAVPEVRQQKWPDIAAHITIWLFPWLYLASQIQFEVRKIGDTLRLLLLCVGSPLLSLHSMFLTILNSRRMWDQDNLDVLRTDGLEDCRNEKWDVDQRKKEDGTFWAALLFAITMFCLGIEEGYRRFDGNATHMTH